MNKIMFFIFGAFVGSICCYLLVSNASQAENSRKLKESFPRQQTAAVAAKVNIQEEECNSSLKLSTQTTTEGEFQLPTVSQSNVDQLITEFMLQGDDLYSSGDFKDLVYLVRHNEQIAAQVKTRIEESESYDERISLVAVLANNESPATLDFATSLIQSMEKETQSLGFDLLIAMGSKGNNPELNAALLDATNYETDPSSLSNIINQLSSSELGEQMKSKAVDSFQRLMYENGDNIVTARAIDGLNRLGNQNAILAAVVEHLNHPDENVKTSAINAMSNLDKNKITPEMVETLRSIVKNPQESELAREYANTFLKNY